MQYSVTTKEKSFREESGIKARWRIGNETHFQETEDGWQTGSFCDMQVRDATGCVSSARGF